MKGVGFLLDFILKYWIEFAFGLVVTFGAASFRYIVKLIKKDRKDQSDEQFDRFYKKIEKKIEENNVSLSVEDKKLNARIDGIQDSLIDINSTITILKEGILALHRKRFIDDCRKLIESEEKITMEDYRRLEREHKTYNALGGNHEGDQLYNMFVVKYKAQISK